MKFPKNWLLYAATILAMFTGCNKNEELSDENEIRASTQEYQDAYNRQDVDKLASLWTPDAIFHNPLTGAYAEGREEIAKLYKTRFEGGEHNQLDIGIKNITFPAPDEAIVNG